MDVYSLREGDFADLTLSKNKVKGEYTQQKIPKHNIPGKQFSRDQFFLKAPSVGRPLFPAVSVGWCRMLSAEPVCFYEDQLQTLPRPPPATSCNP